VPYGEAFALAMLVQIALALVSSVLVARARGERQPTRRPVLPRLPELE
jgi:hypothetical protein